MRSRPAVQLAACVLCTVTGVLAGHLVWLARLGTDAATAPTAPAAPPVIADHPPATPRLWPGEHAPHLVPPPGPDPFPPLARAAAEDVAPRTARPAPLPEPPHALPLQQPQQEPLRGLIARELPGLTAEEAQVWAEELDGLPLEAAREILKFRGAIGREPLTEPALPSVEPSRPVPPPRELPPSGPRATHGPTPMPSTLGALRQAIEVTLNNLANADTPGFKRVELVWSDAGYDHRPTGPTGGATVTVGTGVRLATRLDVSAGPLVESARSWDWAIRGEGFFCVRDGEAIRYTRSGRFSVQDGHIVLGAGDRSYPLEPPVSWPSGVSGVDVLPDGTIVSTPTDDGGEVTSVGRVVLARFDAPEQLRPVGGLLCETTPAAGEPHTAHPGQSGCGTVLIGRLEGSNVDWDAEWEQLARLRHRLECLARLTGTDGHRPPARPVAKMPAVAEPSPVRPAGGTRGDNDSPDAWFMRYFQSEKARSIERNRGID